MRTTYVPGRWLVFRYDLEGPPPIAATTGRLSVAPAVLADPGDYQRVEQDDVLVLEVGMEGVHDGDSVMHGVIDGPRHQLPGEVVSAFGQRHRHLARGHERVFETLAARGYEPRWHIVPGTAHQAMLIVGVVEIAAGLLAALRPHIGGYVVAAWLAGIIVNLLLIPDFYDVACATSASSSRHSPSPGWPSRSARRTRAQPTRGRCRDIMPLPAQTSER